MAGSTRPLIEKLICVKLFPLQNRHIVFRVSLSDLSTVTVLPANIKNKSKGSQMEDWEEKLESFLRRREEKAEIAPEIDERKKAQEFINKIVGPAFEKLETIFNKHGCQAFVVSGDLSKLLEVWYKGTREIEYPIEIRGDSIHNAWKAIHRRGERLKGNGEAEPTEANILNHFVDNYTMAMRHALRL